MTFFERLEKVSKIKTFRVSLELFGKCEARSHLSGLNVPRTSVMIN